MNIGRWVWIASALMLAPAAGADAGPNDRLAAQERRILRGVDSGRLTPGERHRLERDHLRIERLNRSYLRDGRLSRVERHSLDRHLDRTSGLIHRLNQNGRDRFSPHVRPRHRPWGHGGPARRAESWGWRR